MTKQIFTQKATGDSLSASEWNDLTSYINTAVDEINSNNSQPSAIDVNGVIEVNSKGNTTISSAKHINLEPTYDPTGSDQGTYGDIQFKPGDDITFESHHRSTDKRDEITIKTSNGQSGASKQPVKLQIIANDMTLSSKGKPGADSNVMNINITDGSGKGYLKVRAQAIDLRCEDHGGIALQPKGKDSQNHMNKIKFEHGGGDGLEFATFNTEKTSIFTSEYRFNKNGVWMMATRDMVTSDKYDDSDDTTQFKYTKQADDFYDHTWIGDEQCTTKDIIKTAASFNGKPAIHTKITNGGNLEIASQLIYKFESIEDYEVPNEVDPYFAIYSYSGDFDSCLYEQDSINNEHIAKDTVYLSVGDIEDRFTFYAPNNTLSDYSTSEPLDSSDLTFDGSRTIYVNFDAADNGPSYIYKLTPQPIPDIKIESGAKLKLGGILDFGSTFNFGETDNGIEVQYKLTKKNAEKDCGILKVIGVNNHATESLTVDGVIIGPGQTQVIQSCSILDIIKLVNYMKTNNEGPWSQQQPL